MAREGEPQPTIDNTLHALQAHYGAGKRLDTGRFLADVYRIQELGFAQEPKVDNLLKLLGRARRKVVGDSVLRVLQEAHQADDVPGMRRNIAALEMLGLNGLPQIGSLIGVLNRAYNLDKSSEETEITDTPPDEAPPQEEDLGSWTSRNHNASKNRKHIWGEGGSSGWDWGSSNPRIDVLTHEVTDRKGNLLSFETAMFPSGNSGGGTGGYEARSERQSIFVSGSDHIAVYATGAPGYRFIHMVADYPGKASSYRLAHRAMWNLGILDDVIADKSQLSGIGSRVIGELRQAFDLAKDLPSSQKALSVVKFCYLDNSVFAVVGYTPGNNIYLFSNNRMISLTTPTQGIGVSITEVIPGSRILMTQGDEITKAVPEKDIKKTLQKVNSASFELVEATRKQLAARGVNNPSVSALVIDVQRKPKKD